MGTSLTGFTSIAHSGDHPHAYGDKLFFAFQSIFFQGSSPRVWGQGVANGHKCYSPGIIPTRMGTSRLSPFGAEGSEDHPHAYGDKSFWKKTMQKILGSSPRVWGQGLLTKNHWREKFHHPHAYGDKDTYGYNPDRHIGSSPRVWGQGQVYRKGYDT